MAVVMSPETRFQQKGIELLKSMEPDLEILKSSYQSYTILKVDDVKICHHGFFRKTEYRSRRILGLINLSGEKKLCCFFVYGKDFFALAQKMAEEINSVLGDFKVELLLCN